MAVNTPDKYIWIDKTATQPEVKNR